MTKKEKIQLIKDSTTPEEYKAFLSAAKAIQKMNCVSISYNRDLYEAVIVSIGDLRFDERELVAELSNGICEHAKLKYEAGLDGEGTYFID